VFAFGRRTTSLIERLAPHLPLGRATRNEEAREQLEREAEAEMQARIDLGRPGPEEFERTRPIPDWLLLRRPPMRAMDLVEVNLDVVVAPVPTPAQVASQPPARQEGLGSGRRSGAGSGA
jgi:hypothetical protein